MILWFTKDNERNNVIKKITSLDFYLGFLGVPDDRKTHRRKEKEENPKGFMYIESNGLSQGVQKIWDK